MNDDRDDSDRLKACPFCGGDASAGFISDGDNAGGHYISCDQCDASTGLRFSCGEDARPILAEQWNKRAELATLRARCQAMENDVRRYLHLRDCQEATKRRMEGLSVVVWEGKSEGQILRGDNLDAYLDRLATR